MRRKEKIKAQPLRSTAASLGNTFISVVLVTYSRYFLLPCVQLLWESELEAKRNMSFYRILGLVFSFFLLCLLQLFSINFNFSNINAFLCLLIIQCFSASLSSLISIHSFSFFFYLFDNSKWKYKIGVKLISNLNAFFLIYLLLPCYFFIFLFLSVFIIQIFSLSFFHSFGNSKWKKYWTRT